MAELKLWAKISFKCGNNDHEAPSQMLMCEDTHQGDWSIHNKCNECSR
jgi:hypothetical protein